MQKLRRVTHRMGFTPTSAPLNMSLHTDERIAARYESGHGAVSSEPRFGAVSPVPRYGAIDPGARGPGNDSAMEAAATITDAVDKKLASRLSRLEEKLEEQIHARMDDKVVLLRAHLKSATLKLLSSLKSLLRLKSTLFYSQVTLLRDSQLSSLKSLKSSDSQVPEMTPRWPHYTHMHVHTCAYTGGAAAS
mgnify:CR=1 FL=1